MDTHSDEGLLVETRGLTNDSVSAPPSTTSTCAFLQGRLRPARANGAGKTTLIRTLLGLTTASAGTMKLMGLPVPQQRGTRRPI